MRSKDEISRPHLTGTRRFRGKSPRILGIGIKEISLKTIRWQSTNGYYAIFCILTACLRKCVILACEKRSHFANQHKSSSVMLIWLLSIFEFYNAAYTSLFEVKIKISNKPASFIFFKKKNE